MSAQILNPALPGIKEIQSLANGEMAAVNDLIRERLSSDVALINQISEHIIAAGGKRLRPMLATIVARALGHGGGEPTQLAAIIEFIHTATLLHDDVVDESNLRRGRKTANALWGNAPSVLVGDFLYSRAFQLMVELDNMTIQRVLADATNAIATCAFTATLDTSVLTGNLSFMTGVLTGSFSDPTNTPTTGPLAGRRR